MLLQFSNAAFGSGRTAATFEVEGFGNNANRQNTAFTRHAGDDGRGTRSGSTAHTGRNENKIRTLKLTIDFLSSFFCSFPADFRFGSGTQTPRQVWTELDATFSFRMGELLCVGVGNNKFHALEFGCNHVVNGVGTTTADANHGNPWRQFNMGIGSGCKV
ncbi:hypothetical protein AA103587_1946 [Gluconobacter kanchanaburiensis NBRC 103587]|nr:hypothetical protein AA103587_1946 [Gluconobacter kanchanaburiensis NBRC 103587]